MLSVKEKGLLLNIIKHCKRINERMKGLTREQFDSDLDSFEIICFNILQIGELSKNFEEDFLKRYGEMPWKQIKGMRDKVAHGYDTINKEKIWKTASKDIDPLLDYCLKILKENN